MNNHLKLLDLLVGRVVLEYPPAVVSDGLVPVKRGQLEGLG